MPVFVLGIAWGYIVTKNVQKYYTRILVLAVISEIPHALALGVIAPNICWMLLVSLAFLESLKKSQYTYLIIFMFLSYLMMGFTGLYILTMVTAGYELKDRAIVLVGVLVAVTVIYCMITSAWLQIFAIMYFPFIIMIKEMKYKLPIPRQTFYVYYPAHLMGIFVLHLTVGKFLI